MAAEDDPLYKDMRVVVIATYCITYGIGILIFGGLGYYWYTVVKRWANRSMMAPMAETSTEMGSR